MNDPHDIHKLLEDAKKGTLPPGMEGAPLLGQQVPVMHGIPVNNKIMTIYELAELSDLEFRELFLAAIGSLAGGVYMAPPAPAEEEDDPEVDSIIEEMKAATASASMDPKLDSE